jgi:hypothetical protein
MTTCVLCDYREGLNFCAGTQNAALINSCIGGLFEPKYRETPHQLWGLISISGVNMKNYIKSFLAIAALLLSPSAVAQPSLDDLNWLAGCWAGMNGKVSFREHWMSAEGGIMLGMGRTISDGKLASYEAMRIELDADGKLVFVPKPSGKAEARFPLLKKEGSSFIFENLQHDFPQRVIYQKKDDGSLHARIEGERNGKLKGIDFPMQRASCN